MKPLIMKYNYCGHTGLCIGSIYNVPFSPCSFMVTLWKECPGVDSVATLWKECLVVDPIATLWKECLVIDSIVTSDKLKLIFHGSNRSQHFIACNILFHE